MRIETLEQKAELERLLAAKEKTISVLMRRVEQETAEGGSALDHIREMHELEVIVGRKTTELEGERRKLAEALQELKNTQDQLLQAQKLEAIGQLAAGIAHEINTPIQFVGDTASFLEQAFKDITTHLDAIRSAGAERMDEEALLGLVKRLGQDPDLVYLLEEVPAAFARLTDGLERVAGIVRSMRTFSRSDMGRRSTINLNEAIEATLMVSRNEYKYVSEVATDFRPLPPILCYAGEFNQVMLNLVVNAAHAISDRFKGQGMQGRITVGTREESGSIHVSVADNGCGIPHEIRSRIFDPFFTTKEPGKGTGQGLAISRTLVVDKMGGELWFDSEVGSGTTFHIRLPLAA